MPGPVEQEHGVVPHPGDELAEVFLALVQGGFGAVAHTRKT